MKRLLLNTYIIILFSASMIIFQISCQKEYTSNPQSGNSFILPPATTNTLGGIIVGSGLSVTGSGLLTVTSTSSGLSQLNKLIYKKMIGNTAEIWVVNYDGSSNTKINITLPSGVVFSDDMQPLLSPNGQKIFFTAGSVFNGDLYSCNIDGSNVSKIVDKGNANNNLILGGAY